MNHFNICPICIHHNSCVLTTQKDKVWSCSEFEALGPRQSSKENSQPTKHELELI